MTADISQSFTEILFPRGWGHWAHSVKLGLGPVTSAYLASPIHKRCHLPGCPQQKHERVQGARVRNLEALL